MFVLKHSVSVISSCTGILSERGSILVHFLGNHGFTPLIAVARIQYDTLRVRGGGSRENCVYNLNMEYM